MRAFTFNTTTITAAGAAGALHCACMQDLLPSLTDAIRTNRPLGRLTNKQKAIQTYKQADRRKDELAEGRTKG